jgi:cytoplasmic FMR1 interacting protein
MITDIQMFLGNNKYPRDLIMHTLKEEIHKVSGFEEILGELVDFILNALGNNRNFLLPSEKHMYLRVAIHLIFLADGEDFQDFNVFKSKKIKIEGLQKLFKRIPVIPLMCDMQIKTSFVLERCVHYEKEKMEKLWVRVDAKTFHRFYSIHEMRHEVLMEHNSFATKFSFVLNDLKARRSGIDDSQVGVENFRLVYWTLLEGLMLLSKWKSKIMSALAWKRAFPIPDDFFSANGGKESTHQEYEKITRFAYSNEELYGLCEILGIVKACSDLYTSNEFAVAAFLRRYMYFETQDFVQNQ